MTELPPGCVAVDEDLSALIDEELSSEREAVVRAHVDGCDRCARRLEALCDVDLTLASEPLPEVPADLHARLRARIDAESTGAADAAAAPPASVAPGRERTAPPAPRRRAFGGRVAALAAVAAAVMLALWLTVRRDDGAVETPQARAPSAEGPTAVPEGGLIAQQTPTLRVPEPELASVPVPVPVPEPEAAVAAEAIAAAEPPPERVDGPPPDVSDTELAALPVLEVADLSEEDVAMLLELDSLEDLELLANLDLLEALVGRADASEAG